MNKTGNERFYQTQEKLIRTYIGLLSEMEPEKISITRLCDECGLHRSSFYLHFEDMIDLMKHVEENLAKMYGEIFAASNDAVPYSLEERFLILFRTIQDNQNFYKAYWSRAKDLKVLQTILSEKDMARMSESAERYGFADKTVLQYHQLYFRSGIAAIIGFWLSRDCRETPEEMLQILRDEYRGRQSLEPTKHNGQLKLGNVVS